MSLDRREALKVLATAGAATAAAAAPAAARPRKVAPDDAVGMLFDATKCVGCKACMVACKQANDLAYDDPDGLWDAPVDLTGNIKTVIKLYDDGSSSSFMKAQCLHCIDPACASACMLGAYKKREFGIVTWDGSKCVGCRYCQIACPYGVPRFEWDKALPKMVKCEMCNHRLAEGREPACTEVCPRQAVIFGRYTDLLADAKQRVASDPERYYQKVFGEKDGGGTQVLYLAGAGVDFQKLGLPDLGELSVPHLPETVQHFIYKGFVAPVALYAALAAVMWRNRRNEDQSAAAPEEV
ncbi:MAG TPA: hydrogenase 2 operon protein HybA [Longimicrobiales bacterium]|nr:hydrogenase 2 operon protein HybA [Longimicrobiales bacterium]